MTMAHSLEARSPFLDVEWVEWTARLPTRFKTRRLTTKWLLKAAFADKLPRNIRLRSKQSFSVPVGAWLRNELHDWTREWLENHSLAAWFQPAAVQRLLKEHDSGKINHGKRLWALLIFSVWSQKYLRG